MARFIRPVRVFGAALVLIAAAGAAATGAGARTSAPTHAVACRGAGGSLALATNGSCANGVRRVLLSLSTVRAARGPRGATGAIGATGATGATGAALVQGVAGPSGATVAALPNGMALPASQLTNVAEVTVGANSHYVFQFAAQVRVLTAATKIRCLLTMSDGVTDGLTAPKVDFSVGQYGEVTGVGTLYSTTASSTVDLNCEAYGTTQSIWGGMLVVTQVGSVNGS